MVSTTVADAGETREVVETTCGSHQCKCRYHGGEMSMKILKVKTKATTMTTGATTNATTCLLKQKLQAGKYSPSLYHRYNIIILAEHQTVCGAWFSADKKASHVKCCTSFMARVN